MQTIELNQLATDVATKTVGTLTGLIIDANHACSYLFQPHGVNKDDGQPRKSTWVPANRIANAKELLKYEELPAPLRLLGTEVEDVPTGFKGTAVMLIYHLSGCVHVEIQPVGLNKTGETFAVANFDIRRLKGKEVPRLSKEDFDRSKKDKPGGPSLPGLHRPSTSR